MCLAIPMRVMERDGLLARCEAKGLSRTVSLMLLQGEEIAAGDFVMVHAGDAVQKMTEADARRAWDLYDEILSAGA
jgi:hydrogenase expression/formation protein HypC